MQIIRHGTYLSIISARCSLKAQWRGDRYTRLHHLRDRANVMECSLLAPCQRDARSSRPRPPRGFECSG